MIVLDTESLLIFYLGEVGADVVEDLLKKVLRGDIKGYLNVEAVTLRGVRVTDRTCSISCGISRHNFTKSLS